MARLLDNWLLSFRDWTVPRSEAQESLIIWTGLFTLASVVKRKVKFPKRLMGSYAIYPNLYVIFVGPPGVVRKSTTAAFGEDLLKQVEGIRLASTAVSASKLIEDLSNVPDGSISIISSEFSSFVSISKEEMYDLLTDIYDGKISFEYATRMHGVELIESPCINLHACTTPEWVESQMPGYVLGGGFGSRTIFVCERQTRQRQLYYNLEWGTYTNLEEQLVHDLIHIAQVEGEFRHDSKETKQAIEEWYQGLEKEDLSSGRLAGYAARKHVHVHKVAMLLSLCERDDKIVTMGHFNAAISLMEGVEKNLPEVFQSAGRNPIALQIHAVLGYLQRQTQATPFNRLLAYFYQDMNAEILRETLSTLAVIGSVEKLPNPNGKGDPLYKAVPLTDQKATQKAGRPQAPQP